MLLITTPTPSLAKTSLYRALYQDAVFAHKYGGRKLTETSFFEFFYKSMKSSLEELLRIKVIFIPRKRNFDRKIGKVFSLRESFPGRCVNTASRKSLEIQASSNAERRTLSCRKFV